jgi:hypothetical protein
MSKKITRHDPRYVTQDDPRAVLVAWVSETVNMGGWTDDVAEEFQTAVIAEYRHGTGTGLHPEDIMIRENIFV